MQPSLFSVEMDGNEPVTEGGDIGGAEDAEEEQETGAAATPSISLVRRPLHQAEDSEQGGGEDELLLNIDTTDRMESENSDSSFVTVVLRDSDSETDTGPNAAGTGAGTGTVPEPDLTSSEYKANFNYRGPLYEIEDLDGNKVIISRHGTLQNAGDNRVRNTVVWSDTRAKQNVTSSFDITRMTCVACEQPHDIRDETGRAVILLGDQLQPPAYPTGNSGGQGGKCVGIVRIEDAQCIELSKFAKERLVPQLSSGSVIYISAGTELARCGVSTYVHNAAAAICDLKRNMPQGCYAAIAPHGFLPGCDDESFIAATLDLIRWIKRAATKDPASMYLTESFTTLEEIIMENAGELLCHMTSSKVIFPNTISDRTPTVLLAGGRNGPKKIKRMSESQEVRMFTNLVMETMFRSQIRLSCALKYGRRSDQVGERSAKREEAIQRAVPPRTDPHYIFVGGGHAARMRVAAVEKGLDTSLVVLQTITRSSVPETADKIKRLIGALENRENRETHMVFAGLDNHTFLSLNDEGVMNPGICDERGITHFPGMLSVATEVAFKSLVEQLDEILKIEITSTVIVVALPRFLNGSGCCSDSSHVTNIKDPNFKADMTRGIALGKNAINRQLVAKQLWNVKAINVTPKFASEKNPIPDSMPTDGDNVHLELSSYNTVLDEIIATLVKIKARDDSHKDLAGDGAGGEGTRPHRNTAWSLPPHAAHFSNQNRDLRSRLSHGAPYQGSATEHGNTRSYRQRSERYEDRHSTRTFENSSRYGAAMLREREHNYDHWQPRYSSSPNPTSRAPSGDQRYRSGTGVSSYNQQAQIPWVATGAQRYRNESGDSGYGQPEKTRRYDDNYWVERREQNSDAYFAGGYGRSSNQSHSGGYDVPSTDRLGTYDIRLDDPSHNIRQIVEYETGDDYIPDAGPEESNSRSHGGGETERDNNAEEVMVIDDEGGRRGEVRGSRAGGSYSRAGPGEAGDRREQRRSCSSLHNLGTYTKRF